MRFGFVAANTLIVYVYLIVLMRLFGRRQLGQLTPIDLLVVILLGSCVETAMIHGDTGLRAGLLSAAVLLASNWLLSTLLARSRHFRRLLVSGPVLVVHNGRLLEMNMRKLGLTKEDVLEGLRGREVETIEQTRFATVEPDGTINAIAMSER